MPGMTRCAHQLPLLGGFGTLGATRLLYVVGLPQRRHYDMVYAAATQAGWLAPPARAEPVGFGSILGPDGRMLRSRAGGSVKLVGLLEEAIVRATALARERNPDLAEGGGGRGGPGGRHRRAGWCSAT